LEAGDLSAAYGREDAFLVHMRPDRSIGAIDRGGIAIIFGGVNCVVMHSLKVMSALGHDDPIGRDCLRHQQHPSFLSFNPSRFSADKLPKP